MRVLRQRALASHPPLRRFAQGAGSLLDFACGRGGDIWKWIDAGIPLVKGIDLSPGEIEEARKRWVGGWVHVAPVAVRQCGCAPMPLAQPLPCATCGCSCGCVAGGD